MKTDVMAVYSKLYIAVSGVLEEVPEDISDMIEDFSIEIIESGATTISFTLHDPNFYYINSTLLTDRTAVAYEVAWHGDLENMFRFDGFISLINPSFEGGGYPMLELVCMDETHVMNREEKTRTFNNMKRCNIVKQIFAEYGIPCEVQDSGERYDDIPETITQSNQTDIAFCQQLAGEVIGNIFICYLQDGKGYWGVRNLATEAVKEFNYRGSWNDDLNDIQSFNCSINKETKKVYKTTANINTSNKTTVTATATAPSKSVKSQTDTKSVNNTKKSAETKPEEKKSGTGWKLNKETGSFEKG